MASSAGPHGNTTYPAILQRLLDEKVGAGAYEVSMFALGGTTMSRTGDKTYWDTQEFDAFVARGRWDTVVVMLGTNDAKDAILASALSVVRYDGGVDWDGETVTFVVGIAGVGDEHLEILSQIAILFSDEDDVARLKAAATSDDLFAIVSAAGV